MAITDNSFELNEFEAAVEATPALLDSVVKAYLTKKEMSVLSKAEQEALEGTHISKYVSQFAPQLEKYVEETTGIKKTDASEKYTAYNERAIKTLVEQNKTFSEELKTLKSGSDLSKIEREQLESLKEVVKANQAKIKELEDGSAQSLKQAKMENRIVQEINTVTPKLIKDDRPGFSKAIGLVSNSIFEEIQKNAEVEPHSNKIVVKGADGKALINADGTFKTVAQVFEERMTEEGFVDTGKKQPGAGGQPIERTLGAIPATVKNQADLMDWLRDNTMKGKSQSELVAEFDKYAHLLPR